MSRRAQNEWNGVCMKVYGGCSENYEGVRRNMEARSWHVVVEDVVKDQAEYGRVLEVKCFEARKEALKNREDVEGLGVRSWKS